LLKASGGAVTTADTLAFSTLRATRKARHPASFPPTVRVQVSAAVDLSGVSRPDPAQSAQDETIGSLIPPESGPPRGAETGQKQPMFCQNLLAGAVAAGRFRPPFSLALIGAIVVVRKIVTCGARKMAAF
jgi:hypothetical protein